MDGFDSYLSVPLLFKSRFSSVAMTVQARRMPLAGLVGVSRLRIRALIAKLGLPAYESLIPSFPIFNKEALTPSFS